MEHAAMSFLLFSEIDEISSFMMTEENKTGSIAMYSFLCYWLSAFGSPVGELIYGCFRDWPPLSLLFEYSIHFFSWFST